MNELRWTEFLLGAAAMGSFTVALFFLRFWRQSLDRLFLMFAIAFAVFGLNRLLLFAVPSSNEATAYIYALRLAGFILIIIAILDKNIERSRGSKGD